MYYCFLANISKSVKINLNEGLQRDDSKRNFKCEGPKKIFWMNYYTPWDVPVSCTHAYIYQMLFARVFINFSHLVWFEIIQNEVLNTLCTIGRHRYSNNLMKNGMNSCVGSLSEEVQFTCFVYVFRYKNDLKEF